MSRHTVSPETYQKMSEAGWTKPLDETDAQEIADELESCLDKAKEEFLAISTPGFSELGRYGASIHTRYKLGMNLQYADTLADAIGALYIYQKTQRTKLKEKSDE